jgi:hypothetical protein
LWSVVCCPKPEPKLEDKQHIDAEERDDVAA